MGKQGAEPVRRGLQELQRGTLAGPELPYPSTYIALPRIILEISIPSLFFLKYNIKESLGGGDLISTQVLKT